MEFVKRLTSPLSRNALVKWTFGLLWSSFAVLKPIFYVRHQKLFITAGTVKMNRKLRVSEKVYKASKMKSRMDNARSHSRRFGFGDFEHTQSTTVFLAITQHNVIKRVKANMWNRIKRLPNKCSTI